MGLLDSMTNAVGRGSAAAVRIGRTTQLRQQKSGLLDQRKELAAQLGASLYETVRADAALLAGREGLVAAMARIDVQCAEIDAQIAQVEAQATYQNEAHTAFACLRCGATVYATDVFCASCGASVAEMKAAMSAGGAPVLPSGASAACPACGKPANPGDAFCVGCGRRLQ